MIAIKEYQTITSTQDIAFQLAAEDRLPVWGSCIAKEQTAGRGQMGRNWQSITGNLMVSVRLPFEAPFTTQAAAVAFAALAGSALKKLGYNVSLKWPNDLGRMNHGQFQKYCGILVEEKNNFLIAGVGLNLIHSPASEELRNDNALPGCAIFENGNSAISPFQFWSDWLEEIVKLYGPGINFLKIWPELANEMLVWKGEKICFQDNNVSHSGKIIKIDTDGALLVRTGEDIIKLSSGSIMPE